MGILSNTKQILAATGGAISQGMELLAQGASGLERVTYRISLETRIWALNDRRKKAGDEWFHPSNTEKSEELINTYETLIREFPLESGPFKLQLAQLHADRRALQLKLQVESIVALDEFIKSKEYKLAIDAINVRKRLIKLLNELLAIGRKNEHGVLLQRATSRIEELNFEIAEYELKRKTTDLLLYESGTKKQEAERYDGKLHGDYHQWYKNDNLRWHITFFEGRPLGGATLWREDGSKYVDAKIESNSQFFKFYAADHQLLFTAQITRANRTIEMMAAGLKGIKFSFLQKPSKFRIFIKCLTPRVLLFLWRSRKPSPEKALCTELLTISEGLQPIANEIRSIK